MMLFSLMGQNISRASRDTRSYDTTIPRIIHHPRLITRFTFPRCFTSSPSPSPSPYQYLSLTWNPLRSFITALPLRSSYSRLVPKSSFWQSHVFFPVLFAFLSSGLLLRHLIFFSLSPLLLDNCGYLSKRMPKQKGKGRRVALKCALQDAFSLRNSSFWCWRPPSPQKRALIYVC